MKQMLRMLIAVVALAGAASAAKDAQQQCAKECQDRIAGCEKACLKQLKEKSPEVAALCKQSCRNRQKKCQTECGK